MRDKAAKILRKALEKAGKDKLVKVLDNVLSKHKMEDAPEEKITKDDLVNFALESQAKAIENGERYDKYTVAKIEAGDPQFIENYTKAFRDSKKKIK